MSGRISSEAPKLRRLGSIHHITVNKKYFRNKPGSAFPARMWAPEPGAETSGWVCTPTSHLSLNSLIQSSFTLSNLACKQAKLKLSFVGLENSQGKRFKSNTEPFPLLCRSEDRKCVGEPGLLGRQTPGKSEMDENLQNEEFCQVSTRWRFLSGVSGWTVWPDIIKIWWKFIV